MSHEQLVNELYEVVMELHLTRRQMAALTAENGALQTRLAELEPTREQPCCTAPAAGPQESLE
jgi:prefoldin subunit 5